MGKFTPGPWRLVKHTSADCQHMTAGDDWTIYGANEKAICTEGWADEAEANARLIAAAPMLLEALEEITADYADRFDLNSPSTNPGIKSTIKQARAAIAAARGEQA